MVVAAFNGGMGRLPMDVALHGASNAVRVHLNDDDDFMNVNEMGFVIVRGEFLFECVKVFGFYHTLQHISHFLLTVEHSETPNWTHNFGSLTCELCDLCRHPAQTTSCKMFLPPR